jgi:AraC family transcriptional regulator
MNWFELINYATSYIEDHLSEDIKLEDIAKECNVSYHYFTKTFSLITGYSLKEYIRNRRITLASYDITNTDNRIIDIAIKYGYSSNEAFSRAFRKIHGINPSEARRSQISIFTHFPVLHYDIPKPNIISLQYDIIHNIDYQFIGSSMYVVEEDYEETQQRQLDFVNEFQAQYPSTNTLYRVHHNLSYDNRKYDYMVGYLKEEYSDPALQTFHIQANKCIRFLAKNTTEDLIPKIKTIIYDEWEKNKFYSNGICEIEYIQKNEKDKIDFYYIVSIQ